MSCYLTFDKKKRKYIPEIAPKALCVCNIQILNFLVLSTSIANVVNSHLQQLERLQRVGWCIGGVRGAVMMMII